MNQIACHLNRAMSVRTTACLLLVLALLVLSAGVNAAQTTAETDPDSQDLRHAAPSAELSPESVVNIQMTALGQNRVWGGDQGIAVAFRFASPSNRRVTGPLQRFIKMVANPVYSVMLDHKTVEVGEARSNATGDVAQVPVLVEGADNERVGFLFTLSLQQPEDAASDSDASEQADCRCWMTDGVSRVELPQEKRKSI